VPKEIPEELIALINPKRADSLYPFSQLAGAGVAYKLLHALALRESKDIHTVEDILIRYSDLASLGTVADCMPLIGENRLIAGL
jgi:single-stranded-DNA-specific exonuclease